MSCSKRNRRATRGNNRNKKRKRAKARAREASSQLQKQKARKCSWVFWFSREGRFYSKIKREFLLSTVTTAGCELRSPPSSPPCALRLLPPTRARANRQRDGNGAAPVLKRKSSDHPAESPPPAPKYGRSTNRIHHLPPLLLLPSETEDTESSPKPPTFSRSSIYKGGFIPYTSQCYLPMLAIP